VRPQEVSASAVTPVAIRINSSSARCKAAQVQTDAVEARRERGSAGSRSRPHSRKSQSAVQNATMRNVAARINLRCWPHLSGGIVRRPLPQTSIAEVLPSYPERQSGTLQGAVVLQHLCSRRTIQDLKLIRGRSFWTAAYRAVSSGVISHICSTEKRLSRDPARLISSCRNPFISLCETLCGPVYDRSGGPKDRSFSPIRGAAHFAPPDRYRPIHIDPVHTRLSNPSVHNFYVFYPNDTQLVPLD